MDLDINKNLKNPTDFETRFKEIANKLMNEYVIQSHSIKYRITEIEFYWNAPDHEDESTYKRRYVDPKSGEWFFHYSGVDIALRNSVGYGGILIRSIYDIESHFLYKGPMVCSMKLFSGTNAFTSAIATKIIPHDFLSADMEQTPRIGLGNNAKTNGADKLAYRFFINVQPVKKT